MEKEYYVYFKFVEKFLSSDLKCFDEHQRDFAFKYENEYLQNSYGKYVSYKKIDYNYYLILTDKPQTKIRNLTHNGNIYFYMKIDGIKYYLTYDEELILSPETLDSYQSIIMQEVPFIKDYYATKILGKGAFGTVVECVKSDTQEKFAIKMLVKAPDTEIEIKMLKILSEYCSDYFICINEFINTEKNTYIVMEYLQDYVPMDKVINNFSKKLKKYDYDALELFSVIVNNLCNGLKSMHQYGIAHNDIKPANIMVNLNNGKIKYIDFGGGCETEGECKVKAYTKDYVSPESKGFTSLDFKNELKKMPFPEKYISTQSDIWSLGCVIYETIIGKLPCDYYLTINDYFMLYDYSKDKNRKIIRNVLNNIENCNIDLDTMLKKENRTYACNCQD